VEVKHLDVLNAKDIETAFRATAKEHADAVIVLGSPILDAQRRQIVGRAAKSRLPLTSSRPEYVEDGALMNYGVNINQMFRRAATYVDKILKGAEPADLLVEQPKNFEFIINLNSAKQIGLTIPPNVLARADRVIK
jgi:putative tryptophan/tyrosine transport system substrate-binding protein